MANPRDLEGKDGRSYRAMNITVPTEIWQVINDQKYARKSTYAEVIENAIRQTYMDHKQDAQEE